MVTLEEKLNTFSKLVFEKVQNESDKLVEEIKKENEKRIDEHKKEIEKKADNLINKRIEEAENKKKQQVSKVNAEVKKEILAKKKELFDVIVDNIKSLAEDYTNGSEYEDFLKETLVDIISTFKKKDNIIIYLTVKDLNRFKKEIENYLKSIFNSESFKIKTTNKDIIGGVIVINEDGKIKIDSTLVTKVEENRNLIGKTIYEHFKEAGDTVG